MRDQVLSAQINVAVVDAAPVVAVAIQCVVKYYIRRTLEGILEVKS